MNISKWHQELDRFLDIKTTFLLEGNIYDLCAYPTQIEENVRWDMILLDNYIYKYLQSKDYKTIVFYNHIDGFYNDFEADSLKQFLHVAGNNALSKSDKIFRTTPTQAGDMIRIALQDRTAPIAIILMLASRYVLSADNVSEEERDFYTKLMISSLKKIQVKTANGFRNNLMFLITDKANDIPVWFYLDNPMVKSLNINEPDKSSRKMFINTQINSFVGDEKYEEEDLNKYKEAFIDLTDGFKILELNALKTFCKNEGLPISQIKDAINMYKYGLKENPWNDIPAERLDNAESFIHERIKGQEHAIIQTLDIIKRAACNMAGLQHSSGTKPKGVLFFAGPTGTGKTELAKTVSSLLFGDDSACVRFDMSEYQQSHSDQRLLGAPPGYVGYEAGGQLTNAIREKPFSILLFDEIEKAHPSIFDKFLQILEDGRMTDGRGETVYFSECIIIFTSNLGIYTTDEYGRKQLNVSLEMSYDEMRERLISAIKDYFKLQLGRPEILNRIGDNFVVFDFIREDVAKQILESQINKINKTILTTKGITIKLNDLAFQYLLNKSFGNLENGGRGIGNIVEKYYINPLARFIFDNKIGSENTINVKTISEIASVASLECEIY